MSNLTNSWIADIRAARSNTSGLLFFYPLGLLTSMTLSGMFLFFAPTPEKGLYAGEAFGQKEVPLFLAFTLVSFVISWVITIYNAIGVQMWPKGTSFLFGLAYGIMAGILSNAVLFAFIIPITLLFVLFLEALFEHWLLSGALLLFIISYIMKKRRTKKHNAQSG